MRKRREYVSWEMEIPARGLCSSAKHQVEMRREPAESFRDPQVSFLIVRWTRQDFHEAMYMSQTLSSVDHQITLGLSELIGKPAAFIWSEKSARCALITPFSLETLLFRLLQESLASLGREASVWMLKILFGEGAQSWPQYTQRTSSETRDSTLYFRRTSADSLVQSKASFAQLGSSPMPSEILQALNDYGEHF
jgi:hypothetical protein